ncbi:uncharacterized protein LOC143462201 [Clavelina lepadiformis]|uniref:uncharacterized protein LOC143462201 n=1 Tax=Clavelina lepadiformis TaxID=159417 RepID=UPI004041DE72
MPKEAFFFLLFILLQLSSVNVAYGEENHLQRHKRAIGSKPKNIQGSCEGDSYGKTGWIASPNFPANNYPPTSNCSWRITVNSQRIIKFKFVYMDMEDAPVQKRGGCGADFIAFHDGRTLFDPLVGGQRYCGYDTRFNAAFSTTNRVLVNFVSDNAVEKSGFAVQWKAVAPLRPSFNCDFESVNGLCPGWKQSKTDDFDWTLKKGPTPSGLDGSTGPANDHTHKNSDGTYFYVEASGKITNKTATLISAPVRVAKSQQYCFQFWYHMKGAKMGSLIVYQTKATTKVTTENATMVFSVSGSQGDYWNVGQVEIEQNDQPQLFLFVGVVGPGFSSDIAIDDISMRPGACPIITTTTTTVATTTPKPKKKRPKKPKTTPATTTTTSTRATLTTPYVPTTRASCPEGQHTCEEVGNCVERQWFCDGIQDCKHDDDERDCDESGTAPPLESWAGWEEWSTCSKTCGDGSRSKKRICKNGKSGDPGCLGTFSMSENCNTDPCPTWETWYPWSACSVSCAGGIQTRVRICRKGKDDTNCVGPVTQFVNCNGHNCPKWGQWSSWSPCMVTCGEGEVNRNRICVGGNVGDVGCNGSLSEVRHCLINNTRLPSCPTTTTATTTTTTTTTTTPSPFPVVGCPKRNIQLARSRGRKCPPSCTNDNQCSGSMTCNCDGPCGKTCSSPTVTCAPNIVERNLPGRRVRCANGNYVGSKCVISCARNYRLVGFPNMNCQSNGRWDKRRASVCQAAVSTTVTVCPKRNLQLARSRGRTCPAPCTSHQDCTEDDRCQCDGPCGPTCSSPTITCSPDFSSRKLPGRRVSCSKKNSIGSKCTISCQKGYKLIGFTNMNCQSTGEWDKRRRPVCQQALPMINDGGERCRKRRAPHTKCCGLQSYNPALALCCDGQVSTKTQAKDACCGKRLYSSTGTQSCCGERLYEVSSQQCCGVELFDVGSDIRCCGKIIYNVNAHICGGAFGGSIIAISPPSFEEEEEEEE